MRRFIKIFLIYKTNKKLLLLVMIAFVLLFYALIDEILKKEEPEYLGIICKQRIDENSLIALEQSLANKHIENEHVTRAVHVTLTDEMRFTPSYLEVKQNEIIRFVVVNKGRLKHEFVLGQEADLRRHEVEMLKVPESAHAHAGMIHLKAGQTGRLVWKFTSAGQVFFACLQPGHYNAGMKGIVVVKAL
jgi:uncharacterized cupredoxin-like copper-binding protein